MIEDEGPIVEVAEMMSEVVQNEVIRRKEIDDVIRVKHRPPQTLL